MEETPDPPRPEPGAARNEQEFIDALEALKRWSGASFATLSRKTRPPGGVAAVLSTGLIHDRLHGSRRLGGSGDVRPGRRRSAEEFVRHFVLACLRVRKQPDAEQEAGRWVAEWSRVQSTLPQRTELPRPAQLPPDLTSFTGREAELHRIRDAMSTCASSVVVDGMPGIGKTTLTVHIAHLLAPDYPDGQIFVDLHGYTEGVQRVEAADALERLLLSIGTPAAWIPAHVDDRATLWRSSLSGTRTLIVLDNVASESQVRPLLPAAHGCLVLITSRRRLIGLDDAHACSLDVLPLPDARRLFRAAAGDGRRAPDAGLAEVLDQCGRLPLAIRIAASRWRTHPGWTIGDLAELLREEQFRLAELEAGERSVVAAFWLSYRELPEDRKRLFCLLGLHPGADFGAYAVAALAERPVRAAARMLDDLVGAHLLQEPTAGRYRFHDLLRTYARQLAGDDLTEEERSRAAVRLLDYYTHSASTAMDAFLPFGQPGRPPKREVTTPVPDLRTRDAAVAWLEAERASLVAIAVQAAAQGRPERVRELAAIVAGYLDIGAYATEAFTLHTEALAAAHRMGDSSAEGMELIRLGCAARRRGDHDSAMDLLGKAVTLFRQAGDSPGLRSALDNLGLTLRWLGRFDEAERCLADPDVDADATTLRHLGGLELARGRAIPAIGHLERALCLSQQSGDRVTEGKVFDHLGACYRALGQYDLARRYLRAALVLHRETLNRTGESNALNDLAAVNREEGQLDVAIDGHTEALRLAEAIGDRGLVIKVHYEFGTTLRRDGRTREAIERHHLPGLELAERLGQPFGLAQAHLALGHAYAELAELETAREHWREAWAVFDSIGHPSAAEVESYLAQL